jgi:hypothetical protein
MKRVLLIVAGVLMAALCAGAGFADDNRFVISGKGVTDRQTNLTWARNANMARLTWSDASALVKKLNENRYAGSNDWRLPGREELMTLVTYAMRAGYMGGMEYFSPYEYLNKLGFDDVQPYFYWSSSSYGDNASYAEVVGMCNGMVRSENKQGDFYVWPVHGGK